MGGGVLGGTFGRDSYWRDNPLSEIAPPEAMPPDPPAIEDEALSNVADPQDDVQTVPLADLSTPEAVPPAASPPPDGQAPAADMPPVLQPDELATVAAPSHEQMLRTWTDQERGMALAEAEQLGGEDAEALQVAKERAPSVLDQVIDIHSRPGRAAVELSKGLVTGVGDGISGVATFLAVAEKSGEDADLKRMKEIDAGGRPRHDDSDRVRFYFARPEKRVEERKRLERAAAVPLEERWLYKNGKVVGNWLEIKPGDPRYQLFYEIGIEGGKLAVTAPIMYVNPTLGTVVMVGLAAGGETNVAIDEIKDKKSGQDQYLTDEEARQIVEFNQRGVLRNAVTGLPVLKLVGAVGGNYVVRVIQRKTGPGGMRAIGAGADFFEGAASGAASKLWENADARDTFNSARDLNEGVLDEALTQGFLGGAKSAGRVAMDASRADAQHQIRLYSNRYVEPETVNAERALTLAEGASSLTETISKRQSLASKSDIDRLIDERIGGETKAYISPHELTEMIRAGYFFDRKVEELGLREKIEQAAIEGTNVELRLSDLVKGNNIKRTKIDEVMQALKFDENGPTALDAAKFLAGRDEQLKAIERRLSAGDPGIEGSHAFASIRHDLKRYENFGNTEASRQAARRVEVLEERARVLSMNGRRETADTVYLRDEYRRTQNPRLDLSPKEVQRLEDQYVATRLRELGIAVP